MKISHFKAMEKVDDLMRIIQDNSNLKSPSEIMAFYARIGSFFTDIHNAAFEEGYKIGCKMNDEISKNKLN